MKHTLLYLKHEILYHISNTSFSYHVVAHGLHTVSDTLEQFQRREVDTDLKCSTKILLCTVKDSTRPLAY